VHELRQMEMHNLAPAGWQHAHEGPTAELLPGVFALQGLPLALSSQGSVSALGAHIWHAVDDILSLCSVCFPSVVATRMPSNGLAGRPVGMLSSVAPQVGTEQCDEGAAKSAPVLSLKVPDKRCSLEPDFVEAHKPLGESERVSKFAWMPVKDSKRARGDLESFLPAAIAFARQSLFDHGRLLIVDDTGTSLGGVSWLSLQVCPR
jgi:hypothetical protein